MIKSTTPCCRGGASTSWLPIMTLPYLSIASTTFFNIRVASYNWFSKIGFTISPYVESHQLNPTYTLGWIPRQHARKRESCLQVQQGQVFWMSGRKWPLHVRKQRLVQSHGGAPSHSPKATTRHGNDFSCHVSMNQGFILSRLPPEIPRGSGSATAQQQRHRLVSCNLLFALNCLAFIREN